MILELFLFYVFIYFIFKALIVLQVSSKILSSVLFLECLLEPAGKTVWALVFLWEDFGLLIQFL